MNRRGNILARNMRARRGMPLASGSSGKIIVVTIICLVLGIIAVQRTLAGRPLENEMQKLQHVETQLDKELQSLQQLERQTTEDINTIAAKQPKETKYKRVFSADRARASCKPRGPDNKVILVTGTGGFVGFHVAKALHKKGHGVLGLDNFNDYYETSLKRARQAKLESSGIYTAEGDITDAEFVSKLLDFCPFTHVLHLAAQAGVRYAAKNPFAYVHSNLMGFVTLLEAVKAMDPMVPVIYASSSSVYGLNTKVPFSEDDRVDKPASLYAATKKSNEMIAHTYYNIYGMSLTGLRFFTVYGPYGRPDMAYFFFTKAILDGEEIKVFEGPNGETVSRDFTYIDDIVDGVMGAIDTASPSTKEEAEYRLFNLGNTHPEPVTKLVENLELILNKKANKKIVPMPPTGDVLATHANVTAAYNAFGYQPKTNLRTGLRRFISWYKDYYGISNK